MDFRSDQPVPANRDQPRPEDHLVEEQATLTAEEMNGADGESATLESAAPPPPEIMDVPLTLPPAFDYRFLEQNEQHDTAQSQELPSPEEFDHLMRTSGHYHGVLEQLRRAQEEVLRRRLASEWQRDAASVLECVEEAELLWRIREMQHDLENGMRRIGWILQRLVRVDSEIAALRYEAAVALCRVLASQEQLVNLTVAQEAAGEGPTGGGEGAASWAPEDAQRACLRCGKAAAAAVVVMPCNHLCLCVDCGDDGSIEVCPECNGLSAGTVLVGL